jgi:hypothetical protein
MKTGRLVWVLGTKLLPLGRIAHTDWQLPHVGASTCFAMSNA